MTARPRTLTELFRRGRPAEPGRAPLLEAPDGVVLTYDDADRRSAQIAGALAAVGVRSGDRLAVQLRKSPEAVLLYLACMRSGICLIPMNTAYTPDEVGYLLEDAEPAAFLDDSGLAQVVARSAACDMWFADVEPTPDQVAAILYTSGTTGRPKGAVLTHDNLASNAAALRDLWGFTPADLLLHALPIFHAHGLFIAINCVLASGSSMLFLPSFDVDDVLASLPKCTVMMGVPTHYSRLLADPRFDRSSCTAARVIISGSAPMSSSMHAAFQMRTGHTILERYGMTETMIITSNPLDGERRPGTVGRPLAGTDIRISDADDTGAGSIEVRGPGVFRGYHRRPELSTTEFTDDGWFRTGDLGHLDPDGYLTIVGRSKDIVISGGLNVYPSEVEAAIDPIEGVLESAVIGVPDVDFGELVVAVVVAEPGVDLDCDAIRVHVRRHLAAYKVPKRVELVESLPRNALGKVEKAALRARFG